MAFGAHFESAAARERRDGAAGAGPARAAYHAALQWLGCRPPRPARPRAARPQGRSQVRPAGIENTKLVRTRFPRSSDRGLIEARFAARSRVGQRTDFRGPRIAASLKLAAAAAVFLIVVIPTILGRSLEVVQRSGVGRGPSARDASSRRRHGVSHNMRRKSDASHQDLCFALAGGAARAAAWAPRKDCPALGLQFSALTPPRAAEEARGRG